MRPLPNNSTSRNLSYRTLTLLYTRYSWQHCSQLKKKKKKKGCTHRRMTKWEIRAYLHYGTHYAASENKVPTQEGICEILSEKSTLLHECKNNNHLFLWDDVSTCTKCLREFPPVKLLERWDWHVSKRGLCFFPSCYSKLHFSPMSAGCFHN